MSGLVWGSQVEFGGTTWQVTELHKPDNGNGEIRLRKIGKRICLIQPSSQAQLYSCHVGFKRALTKQFLVGLISINNFSVLASSILLTSLPAS